MTACNTDNIKLMMRDAYNNLLDNDNSSMAGGYANGHYIMSHYNPWLDECERLNELLLIHPDQGVGAELAVFYAYTAYTCAANGCLQNGYVLYMLGADVVQKYGSSKEQNALREVGRFCPAHFDTTPASYDMYFFEVMKKRAEHFAGYLNDMVDEKCMVKAEYAKGLAQVLPELNRRARIFEAYMTTKDMAKNWQNFAPYVADIYLYMAKVAYAAGML